MVICVTVDLHCRWVWPSGQLDQHFHFLHLLLVLVASRGTGKASGSGTTEMYSSRNIVGRETLRLAL